MSIRTAISVIVICCNLLFHAIVQASDATPIGVMNANALTTIKIPANAHRMQSPKDFEFLNMIGGVEFHKGSDSAKAGGMVLSITIIALLVFVIINDQKVNN